MKTSAYKNYDDLPLLLNASLVAQVLGVSPSSGYELMHVVVTTHRRILQRQKEYDRRHPRDALCAPISAPAAHLTRPNSANRCTALERRKARDEEKRGEAGESTGAFAAPVRSQPPAVRAVSGTEADAFLKAGIFD